jgi:tight adherence protein B
VELTVLVAPGMAFLVILLFGLGVYQLQHRGGLLARRRVAAFAPQVSSAAFTGMMLGENALFKRQRFSSIDLLDRLLQRKQRGAKMAMELARAGMPLRVGEFLMMRWLAGGLFALLVWKVTAAAPMIIVAAVAGYFLPVLYVRRRQAARLRTFDDQLVDGLVLLANSLKSGYSFLQGMEAIAREMPAPIGAEFDEVLREIRIGGSVEEALLNMSERIRSADFELVVTAMVIQRQVGGNLTEVLANIAYTVRERHRILREVRVLTAQERASGYLVASLPVFLVFLLSLINPHYISGMWAEQTGKALLCAGFVMAALGLLVMRKMVDIDV